MGYAVYENTALDRWQGYGVPAYCDAPGCKVKIDRGMGYACGEPMQDQFGCGRFFCEKHMSGSRKPKGETRYYEYCNRCYAYKRPYKTTAPEHPEWMRHLLRDPSWKEWRDLNPAKVAEFKERLKK